MLFSLLKNDIRCKARHCYESDSRSAIMKTLLTDGTMAMIYYRLMQWSRRHKLVPLEMIFNKLNVVFCNCIIGRGAEFGPGFVLVHATGVVINGMVRGGSNVYIYHQVTVGAATKDVPVLGDDVLIGAGAKVLGAIKIGNGVRIGANAVVVRDLPSNVTAIGIPARIVRTRSQETSNESADDLPSDGSPS